jgi:hypothetical protein
MFEIVNSVKTMEKSSGTVRDLFDVKKWEPYLAQNEAVD